MTMCVCVFVFVHVQKLPLNFISSPREHTIYELLIIIKRVIAECLGIVFLCVCVCCDLF